MSKANLGLIVSLLSMLVALCSSASASAANVNWLVCKNVGAGNGVFESPDCQKMGAIKLYAWAKEVAGTGVVVTGGPVVLKGKVAGVPAEIECSSDATTGTGNVLGEEGASTGTLAFKSCTVKSPEPTKCAVTVANLPFKAQVVTGSPEPEVEVGPATGTVFLELALASKAGQTCIAKGTYSAKGTQTCKLPKALEGLLAHTIECTAAGSHLELGGTATFTNKLTAELTTAEYWKAE